MASTPGKLEGKWWEDGDQLWVNSPKKATNIKPVENPVWWDDIKDKKEKASLESIGWIQKSWDYAQEEGRKKWELANPSDPDPKRWLLGIAMHLFPIFMIFIVLGPAEDAFAQMKALMPDVLQMKYMPLLWTLPVIALLPKYIPESASLIHYIVAAIGVASALRWWYYYFLSGGDLGDWLNNSVTSVTGQSLPAWAFPKCETAKCYTNIYDHIFGVQAYNTHAFCTWDGLSIIFVSTMHIIMDGEIVFEEQWQHIAYVLGNIAFPEVTYPLFLLRLGSFRGEVSEKRMFNINMDRNFMLYTAVTFLVCLLPLAFSAHNRIVVLKSPASTLNTHVWSNASSVRGFELIMVIPFSILTYILPTYGEETKKRSENTGLVWIRKLLIWNASLSHVGAALAAFLAFRDLDSDEDRVRHELMEEVERGVQKDD